MPNTSASFDPDLGPSALKIQNSFVCAWKVMNPAIFLGLYWAYEDCENSYAAEEAYFLYQLAVRSAT